jgi:monofunctional biosynthetic peptidoglycan transglycosylase
VVLIKFVNPPITITQITNAFGLGLKRDYVSWEDMSYNIKLAAIASEDQVFPDHIGFDFDAMEKSLRPKKKKKKSRIPLGGGASTITLLKMFFYGRGVDMINILERSPSFILLF